MICGQTSSTAELLALVRAVVVAVTALAAVGCGSDSSDEKVVAVVAGTPIHRSQLERAVEHARAAAERDHKRFPDENAPEFRRTRHAILGQLVLNLEVSKAAKELGVAVPTAAVYEFAEEQGEEEQQGEEPEEPPSAEDAAHARSTVRARLLYEAVARKGTAAAQVQPREG